MIRLCCNRLCFIRSLFHIVLASLSPGIMFCMHRSTAVNLEIAPPISKRRTTRSVEKKKLNNFLPLCFFPRLVDVMVFQKNRKIYLSNEPRPSIVLLDFIAFLRNFFFNILKFSNSFFEVAPKYLQHHFKIFGAIFNVPQYLWIFLWII